MTTMTAAPPPTWTPPALGPGPHHRPRHRHPAAAARPSDWWPGEVSCSGRTGRVATTTATCTRRPTTSPASGYAITSTSIDLATGADWVPVSSALGTARIQVTGADSGPTSSSASRAWRTGRTTSAASIAASSPTWARGRPPAIRTGAGAPSTPPGEQDFWVAQAERVRYADADLGAGRRQLDARGHERRRVGRGVLRRAGRCDGAGADRLRLGAARRRACSSC